MTTSKLTSEQSRALLLLNTRGIALIGDRRHDRSSVSKRTADSLVARGLARRGTVPIYPMGSWPALLPSPVADAVRCTRCGREAAVWPLERGDRCAPAGWQQCIRVE